MLRQWFSITAVLAGAAFLLAIDASQAQERRLGRRFRGDYYEYVPASPPSEFRSADSYASAAPMQPNQVALEVRVPADAEIFVDGAKTVQKGTLRRFVSPPIPPGPRYTYEIKAKWMEGGREVSQIRKLNVRAGDRLSVDLTRPATEMMPTDSRPAREGRSGRRLRGDSYEPVPASPPSELRRADYYTPETARSSMQPNQVSLEVRVPADAEIFVEGEKTAQKGTLRRFVSPPITPGTRYTYEIKAKWMEGGREVDRTRKVDVRAGDRLRVDLTKPSEEKDKTKQEQKHQHKE
jgi:uncharacterized protein (TIGR03000 family)